MANEAQYILTLPEGKDHLGVTADTDNAKILALIGSCTFSVESYIGNAVVERIFTEDYTAGIGQRVGGARRIYLKRYPISSVTSTVAVIGDASIP